LYTLDLNLYFSGGAANSTPGASLGGAKSSAQPVSQTAAAPTNVTGVAINYAAGNAHGNGSLAYTHSTTSLTWASSGNGAATPVDVSADGNYLLEDDAGGYLEITVTAASLPGADASDADIAVAASAQNLFADITKAIAYAGDDEYRCLYVQNDSATKTIFGASAWFVNTPAGDATFELGVDPAGANAAAATIADENTAPAGVTFASADSSASKLDLGVDLAPGDYIGLWLHRAVPAGASTPVPSDLPTLAVGGSE
jgi:hypothetical protein